jgi:hypothetical protein
MGFSAAVLARSGVKAQWELPGGEPAVKPALAGVQWGLPEALARTDQGCARRIRSRNRAFWPDRNPSCALSGRREVLATPFRVVRSIRLPFPPSSERLTFSGPCSDRPSGSCTTQV